jgi:hypothetical protein
MTTPKVPKEKRPKKDSSPPITKVLAEYFQLHTKRPKTNHTPNTSCQKKIKFTATMKDDQPLLISSSKQIISTFLPKKPKKTPPVNQLRKGGPKLTIF